LQVFLTEVLAVILRRVRALIESLREEVACRRVNFTVPEALSAGRPAIGARGFRQAGAPLGNLLSNGWMAVISLLFSWMGSWATQPGTMQIMPLFQQLLKALAFGWHD
jgi:hypothetical protein